MCGNKMILKRAWAAAAMFVVSVGSSALAAGPDRHADVFSRTTETPAPHARPVNPARPARLTAGVVVTAPLTDAGPRPVVSVQSSPEQWFAAVDELVGYYKPTNPDRVIMNQPFNQEVERVNEFCKTAAKIARNYRILAKKLSALALSRSVVEARRYRDLHVNWYNDVAMLYEDMIRPRPPARTQEELAAMLKDLSDRSEALEQSFGALQIMDLDLRSQYHVRYAKHEDKLQQYYTSPTR